MLKVVLGIVSLTVCLGVSASVYGAEDPVNVSQPRVYTSKKYPHKHALGFVRSARNAEFMANVKRSSFTGTSASIPSKYSMRYKAGPVEDQGQCGSCWDFSLTSVLRGTWIMEGKDPGRLSFNYLLNCSPTMLGCNGGDFTAADNFIAPLGAPAYGSDGGYSAIQSACKHEPAVASTIDYHMLGANGTNASFQDIAYVVGVLHRPVSIDVAVDDNWENYSSGVFGACSDENAADINHMVSIEGYDCESSKDSHGNCVFDANGNLPPGVGKWIIRNSWGVDWGDGGYIQMAATDRKGARCNAVATDALYFDVK